MEGVDTRLHVHAQCRLDGVPQVHLCIPSVNLQGTRVFSLFPLPPFLGTGCRGVRRRRDLE